MRTIGTLVVALAIASVPGCGSTSGDSKNQADPAYRCLESVMDQYADRFYIYADADCGGNHYYPSMSFNGQSITIDTGCRENPKAGPTCIRVAWDGKPGANGQRWNGILFNDSPRSGVPSGPGYDLTGAERLTLFARTEKPGLRMKLLFGTAGDSCGEVAAWHTLKGTGWQQLEMPLKGRDLSKVRAGFGIVFEGNAASDSSGVEVFLDEVAVEFERERTERRKEAPRLLQSYSPAAPGTRGLANAAFVYDQALAVSAWTSLGRTDDIRRAKLVAAAVRHCLAHDPDKCAWLRNAYMCGDAPQHQWADEPSRICGFWDTEKSKWLLDSYGASCSTGNMAWWALGCLNLHSRTNDPALLDTATAIADTIIRDASREGQHGFTGGYDYIVEANDRASLTPVTYCSTEHNIDVYALALRLYRLHSSAGRDGKRFLDAARSARAFVESMWNDEEGRYLTGTDPQGKPALEPRPLDTNAWAATTGIATGDRAKRAMDWVEKHCRVDSSDGPAYDFNDDKDGWAAEFTCQAAVAYQLIGGDETGRSDGCLRTIEKARRPSGGVPAASIDGLTTGFSIRTGKDTTEPWLYFNHAGVGQIHLGATCWLLFARTGYNPFFGIPTTSPIPQLPEGTGGGERK